MDPRYFYRCLTCRKDWFGHFSQHICPGLSPEVHDANVKRAELRRVMQRAIFVLRTDGPLPSDAQDARILEKYINETFT
jgi:hypothetical protein